MNRDAWLGWRLLVAWLGLVASAVLVDWTAIVLASAFWLAAQAEWMIRSMLRNLELVACAGCRDGHEESND